MTVRGSGEQEREAGHGADDGRPGAGGDADAGTGSIRCSRCPACRTTRCSSRCTMPARRSGSSIPRHEQAAAYMAFGYARASGKVGVYRGRAGSGAAQHDSGARYRLRDERAGAVHHRPDPVRPDRARLRPAARDPGPARDPARADQMGRRASTPERDRALVNEAFRQMRDGRPRPVGARNAARHDGARGRGGPAGCRSAPPAAAARPGADRAGRRRCSPGRKSR